MKLGVDIGGTTIKFGVVGEGFSIVEKHKIPTPHETGEDIVNAIIAEIAKIRETYDIEGVGIGTPGILDGVNGVVTMSSNLAFSNTPVVAPIAAATGLPVKLGNDASCAMLGELYAGYGRTYKDILMITLGTGVGGGIILGGRPYFGHNGNAGEFGHMVIERDGLPCGCGRRGCFERYASVGALIGLTIRAAEANPASVLAKMAGTCVDGKTAFDAMKAGCPVGADVVGQYIRNLAVGVMNLIMLFQPEIIVFGGAISAQGDWLLNPLRSQLKTETILACSELHNDAGFIGAAAQLEAE